MQKAVIIVFALVAACDTDSQHAAPCAAMMFEGDRFTTCLFDASTQNLALVWKTPQGHAYRNFAAWERNVASQTVSFAMNAGMYDAAGTPIGLYVENGQELRSLNTASGTGNFYMRPNGVFWIDDRGGAHVSETGAYGQAQTAAQWASQSGPLLLIGGALHPGISYDGASRYIRNGVGVDCADRTVFAISEQPVSFGKFARFFRDGLKCRNALYFDGAVSSLWAPSLGRMDARAPLGPMVVVRSN